LHAPELLSPRQRLFLSQARYFPPCPAKNQKYRTDYSWNISTAINQALATVVHAMHNPAHPGPTPILQLAHALRELDLCLVHRHALMQAIDIVRETEDADGLSADELDHLLTRLDRSLHPEEET
jgi:hypothetical protein